MADEVKPIKLGEITWKRDRAFEPPIALLNRYFEENPTNMVDQVALLTRPAITRRTLLGEGPIRAWFQRDGTFEDDSFVVSGDEMYRVKRPSVGPDQPTLLTGLMQGDGSPSISTTEQFMFVTDGFTMQVLDPAVDELVMDTITTPDDIPMIQLAYIGGYTMCVQNNSQRIYWIEPGEKIIDPLNYAEAERFPDWIRQALPLGDQVMLGGSKTTEFWYLTGDALAPLARMQGRLYDRGVWGGTAVKVGDSIITVSDDGRVYDISSGPEPISYYGLDERIRDAMRIQESYL